MTHYWFECWHLGKVVSIEHCEAETTQAAVSILSAQKKGVFRLKDHQTEEQRNKENLMMYERISGNIGG